MCGCGLRVRRCLVASFHFASLLCTLAGCTFWCAVVAAATSPCMLLAHSALRHTCTALLRTMHVAVVSALHASTLRIGIAPLHPTHVAGIALLHTTHVAVISALRATTSALYVATPHYLTSYGATTFVLCTSALRMAARLLGTTNASGTVPRMLLVPLFCIPLPQRYGHLLATLCMLLPLPCIAPRMLLALLAMPPPPLCLPPPLSSALGTGWPVLLDAKLLCTHFSSLVSLFIFIFLFFYFLSSEKSATLLGHHEVASTFMTSRDKPPIEELHQFLEFQLPRQWAPVYCDLPLGPQRRKQSSASLQFAFMGPKLYVDVRKKPVTGLRLYLEGKRSNRLAIHLQHLCSLPQIFQLCDTCHFAVDSHDRKYYEPVYWQHFSHVCTAPVEPEDDLSIVTGAQLHVEYHGLKKVLFLRLQFSSVSNAALVKNHEWEGSSNLAQKSGLISTLISTHFSMVSQKPPPRPADVNINSAVYPGGPPVPVKTPKLLKFVDTTEMSRGPQDSPGYWVVSGAKLHLERGKISLRVKYSLLTAMLPDEEF
ncbi:hypothetical protein ZIOFF_024461 [Zingiber officinale]|uniref:MACPF domain-containing protein n=1 Tax=Zingiber officinale TaxID=94328 RepID=A0A8J5H0D5_ZINOF|nr:hypothetical protein ZIOFF_024461 [Zingiber officinale]